MLTLVPLNPGTPASPGDPCSIQRSKVTTLNHSSHAHTQAIMTPPDGCVLFPLEGYDDKHSFSTLTSLDQSPIPSPAT